MGWDWSQTNKLGRETNKLRGHRVNVLKKIRSQGEWAKEAKCLSMNEKGKEIMAYSPSGILTTINIDRPGGRYVE